MRDLPQNAAFACVGGPLHGQWYSRADRSDTFDHFMTPDLDPLVVEPWGSKELRPGRWLKTQYQLRTCYFQCGPTMRFEAIVWVWNQGPTGQLLLKQVLAILLSGAFTDGLNPKQDSKSIFYGSEPKL